MTDGIIAVGPTLAVVLVLLAAYAAVVVRLGGIGVWHEVLTAAGRAVLQLAVVSLVITAVLASGSLTGVFVAVMAVVASVTSARRLGSARFAGWTAAAIGAGLVPVLGLVLATGLVPSKPIAVVPVAGILIGGAMTATTLAARRALDELRTRHGEYEAALAVGLVPRDAALLVCRSVAGTALVPALDQTRTVGLVTLPGAFVGALLGGAGPLQAGATQVLVLIGLLAVQAAAVLVVVELVARDRFARRGAATSAAAGSAR